VPVIEDVSANSEDTTMPIVTIQVTREGTTPGAQSVTAAEKAALIKGATELLTDVLKKPPESTFVIVEEVDTSNWGWGGLPALEYRNKLATERLQHSPSSCDGARHMQV
jgi:4-oxalocrotonate tautomerase